MKPCDRGVVSGSIASSSRRRPSLKSSGSRPALGARGFFVRVKHTDIESARPVDRGFGPFVRGLPFPPGPESGAGTNTGSGARRLRPVVLSSSAKRRARTSSDTAICSRAGVSIAFPSPPVVASSEMFARTVPAASPRARSGAAASADASRLAAECVGHRRGAREGSNRRGPRRRRERSECTVLGYRVRDHFPCHQRKVGEPENATDRFYRSSYPANKKLTTRGSILQRRPCPSASLGRLPRGRVGTRLDPHLARPLFEPDVRRRRAHVSSDHARNSAASRVQRLSVAARRAVSRPVPHHVPRDEHVHVDRARERPQAPKHTTLSLDSAVGNAFRPIAPTRSSRRQKRRRSRTSRGDGGSSCRATRRQEKNRPRV